MCEKLWTLPIEEDKHFHNRGAANQLDKAVATSLYIATLSVHCNEGAKDLIHGLRGPVQVMVVVAAHKRCKIRCDDT